MLFLFSWMIRKKVNDIEELRVRIHYEYERYFLSMMATSRKNIFAKSGEIELNKEIAFAVKENEHILSEKSKLLLLSEENLLETLVCFVKENQKETESVKQTVQRYFMEVEKENG